MLLIRLCAVAVALLQFDVVAQRSKTPENDAIAQKLNREVCTPSATHIKQLDDIPRAAYLLKECGALFIDPSATPGIYRDVSLESMRSAAYAALATADDVELSPIVNTPGTIRDHRRAALPCVITAGRPVTADAIDPKRTIRAVMGSPVGDLIRAYYGGEPPKLAYTLVWQGPPGVTGQEIHTDSVGLKSVALGVHWALDDLGDEPDGHNGEFAMFPGCFDPDDGVRPLGNRLASEWCEKMQDHRVHEVADLMKQEGIRRAVASKKAGSFMLYDANALHAGCPNDSKKSKLALEFQLFKRGVDPARSHGLLGPLGYINDIFGNGEGFPLDDKADRVKNAMTLEKGWQAEWDAVALGKGSDDDDMRHGGDDDDDNDEL